MEPVGILPLTDECHHYLDVRQVPSNIQKYFHQRYSIFQSYDDGIYLTDDAWFGVTPEPVANAIAKELNRICNGKKILIDAFAGAGGNTIAFALSDHWERIIAVERDASTLACAQQNVEIYDIDESKVTWLHGDSFEYLDALISKPGELHEDLRVNAQDVVVFASPPWGGPGYRSDKIFNLQTMQPYNLGKLHDAYKLMDHVLYLPRTSDVRQLADLVPDGRKIEVVHYCMRGASKVMVAYFPRHDSPSPSSNDTSSESTDSTSDDTSSDGSESDSSTSDSDSYSGSGSDSDSDSDRP